MRHKARTVWADALCINQDDLSERAHQVTLMGRIYSQAERVVVWLGSDDENIAHTAAVALKRIFDACVALELFWKELPRDLESRRPFFQERFTETESEYLIQTAIFHTSESIYEGTSVGWHFYRSVPPPKELDEAAWISLKALYDRKWFQRTWCVQEVRLSKNVICYWAKQELLWSHIGTVAAWLQDIHSRHDYAPDTFPVGIDYESAEKILQATDPRDKVYGVLNLVEKGPLRDSIVVDYEKSVDKVYADTALQIICASSNLDILAAVDHDVDFTGENARYSWAPRWNEDNRPMPLINHDEDRIAAAGTIGPIGSDSDDLVLEGLPFGQVVSTDIVLDDIEMKDNATPGINSPFLTLWNKVMGCRKYSYDNVEWMWTSLQMAETLTVGDGFLGIGEAAAVRRWHLWDDFIAMIEHLFKVTGQENTTDYQMHIIPHDGGDRSRYEDLMWRACDQRRIIWLDNDCYGLGPESIMIFPPKDPPASALPPQRSSETTPPPTINHGKSPPSINDNADAAPLLSFIPTGPRTPNPFMNNLNWQTLGFENPHSFPKRDASFVPVGGREGETPTPPTMTSKQYVASVEAAWQGSEVFDARHELLVEGKSVFDAQVNERRRETCLLGYGKADVKPLKLGGEFGALGWHAKGASAGDGNPGGGRGRGHGRFNSNLSSLLER
ncbi:cell separation during budding [Didymella pomorum]